ncbi:MAG: cell wall-binding repeat-containing protein [Thermoleophilia bacterium]|nr:cell wall-binding repeat-containing protein [Thermoleophilia bacterium]
MCEAERPIAWRTLHRAVSRAVCRNAPDTGHQRRRDAFHLCTFLPYLALVMVGSLAVVVVLLSTPGSGVAAPEAEQGPAAGLTTSDWADISGQIGAEQPPGFSASNVIRVPASRLGSAGAQQAYLKASNTDADDWLGWSVAVSGDTVVVGAYCEDSNATGVDGDESDDSATDSGAAYVFVRSGSTWSQQAYLKASNTGAADHFGWSVAISGDTIVVGAKGEDSSATGVDGNQSDDSASSSGAAYVFVRDGTTWSQQAYLKASNTDAGDSFGWSVAISGDTAVVGAVEESSSAVGVNGNESDDSASEAGAAYVFIRSGSTWSQQAYLKASNTDAGDSFGHSAAVSGDTAVVGAPSEDSNATGIDANQSDNSANSSGAAYVFVRNGTTWSQQAYLKASNTGAIDLFGASVAVSGDTVVVGAPAEDSSATGINGNQSDNSAGSSGAAYVFARDGTIWSQQAYLKASNTDANDSLGEAVAVAGNIVAVGAPGERSNATGIDGNQSDNSAVDAGAVYVYTRFSGAWTQQAYLKASNTEAEDHFGYSVSASADTVVAGAYGEDSGATGIDGNQADNSAADSGAAYASTLVFYTSIRGVDRFDTAIKISQAAFPGALPAGSGVVLAPGWESYQEALCGAPLAAAYGGPVLLSSKTILYANVKDELQRLDPDYVFCIGLTSGLAGAVSTALPSATVTSINGSIPAADDVYHMSYLVAKQLGARVNAGGGDISTAVGIVTIGNNFPDAIGVSPLACYKKWPVLLTDHPDNHPMNAYAVQAMNELGITSYLKAGTYAPDPTGITGVGNFSGADRYYTNANGVIWAQAAAGLTYTHTALTTGDKFPDALAGGPYLAKDHGILLLSPLTGPLPVPIEALLTANAASVRHFTFIACIEPVISQVKGLLE